MSRLQATYKRTYGQRVTFRLLLSNQISTFTHRDKRTLAQFRLDIAIQLPSQQNGCLCVCVCCMCARVSADACFKSLLRCHNNIYAHFTVSVVSNNSVRCSEIKSKILSYFFLFVYLCSKFLF